MCRFWEILITDLLPDWHTDPAGIYLLKVNNRNTKLTIKTPERRRRRSGVFIDNFEHI